MNNPDINIACVANLFSRMMHFKNIGDIELGHTHHHDHLTLLARGKLKVTVEDVSTEFTAPYMIYIHKDKKHELIALEENTVAFCIHALRNRNTGDILDPAMVPQNLKDALDMSEPVIAKLHWE